MAAFWTCGWENPNVTQLKTVHVFALMDGICEARGVSRCRGPNWPMRTTRAYGVHATSQRRTLVIANRLIFDSVAIFSLKANAMYLLSEFLELDDEVIEVDDISHRNKR